jgi:hypothetical protein
LPDIVTEDDEDVGFLLLRLRLGVTERYNRKP